MIANAEKCLREVERLQPGMAVTAEFLGFAHSLRGRFAEAAACYARARASADCGDEQRDVLAFNEARMNAEAGRLEQALAVFAANGKALDARYGHQRSLEEAAILRRLGRAQDARARLDAVLADDTAPANASLQAGQELVTLGDGTAAATALTRAAREIPIADYHLAQLKLQQGDVDSSLVLLGRAAKALPTEVRRRLREEAAAWSAVAADARYLEITRTEAATPVR
jgi:tetratricopeptide (TPR) repeat protein